MIISDSALLFWATLYRDNQQKLHRNSGITL